MTTKARAYREGGRAATAGRGLDTNPYAVRRSGVASVADVAALTRHWTEGYYAEVERIVDLVLAMSDEEILADAAARGIDIHAEAAKCRRILEDAIGCGDRRNS